MAPIPPSAFAAALRDLDGRELAAFVADLWTARGWTTRIEGDTVVATTGDTTRRLLVRPGRLRDRLRPGAGATDSGGEGRSPADADADAIVTPAIDAPDRDGVEVVDATELRRMALYAIDGSDRDRLFDRHLGRSPTATDDSEDTDGGWTWIGDGGDWRSRPVPLPKYSTGVLSLSIVALVVVGFVLAGAVGFGQSNASPAPQQSAVSTPAPVGTPTATPTATPVPWPPGVEPTGVTNSTAFARSHLETIRDTSHTRRQVERTESTDGTLLKRTEISIAQNGTDRRFSIERSGSEALGVAARRIYSSDTIVEQVERGNATTYHQLTEHQLGHRQNVIPSGDRLSTHLLAGTLEPQLDSRSERNGTVVYRLTANGVTDPDQFAWIERVDSPRNLSLWIDIDPRGVVREYRLAYTAERGDRTVRIALAVTYTDVGSTDVERPTWYRRAIENGTNPGHHG